MYKYGMKERGFGMGCQPKGFVKYEDVDSLAYYSFVWYEQPLTQEQLEQYEMEQIDERPIEEKIMEVIDNLEDWEIVTMWNEYCESVEYWDDTIESMSEINDFLYGITPTEILESVQGNDFNIYEDWFKIGTFGYESTSYVRDWIEEKDLVDYIIENEDWMGNSEIREILESEELA